MLVWKQAPGGAAAPTRPKRPLAVHPSLVSPQRPLPMALVVLLKGVNIGGHRTFRPTALAKALRRLGAINVGAAGTFVILKPISRARLRAEIQRRLPFTAEIVICDGRDILDLVSRRPFVGQPSGRAVVQFVSVLARRRPTVELPRHLPPTGRWSVKILSRQHRFVVGLYRREMRAIGYLGRLEKTIGTPMTARSWTTIQSIARLLERREA
jgi:uncharacterized protein (DUF1697 family)